ncbi:hypothetical protein ACTXT7_003826 [Hymenolepis weldensis]
MKASKGTDVSTYGTKVLAVDLELGRIYHWNFIGSDAICPLSRLEKVAEIPLDSDDQYKIKDIASRITRVQQLDVWFLIAPLKLMALTVNNSHTGNLILHS